MSSKPTIDESKLKQKFAESEDLQAAFSGDVNVYIAFKKAEDS